VRNRLRNYHVQTAPVIEWYRSNGTRLRTIDAVGTLDQVLDRVRKSLGT
jgi:adenylate kinase family enzyme